MIFDRFASDLSEKSSKRYIFSVSVTDIHHYETVDNVSNALSSGNFVPYADYGKKDDLDFVGDPGSNIKHSKAIKGIRTDQHENSLGNIFVPVKHSGHVPLVNIGDDALVQVFDDTNKPIYIGALHSKSTNWTTALTRFERPVPPSLEMRGSYGEVATYNPIYITFHPSYEPTGIYFGTKEQQIWYDRFVLFESSDIYRNKKNFVDYNAWIEDTLNSKNKEGGAEHILKLVEDPNNLQYMNKFFYLADKKYPFRPDPVFDVQSSYHQSSSSSAILSTADGTDMGFSSLGLSLSDKYPVTHTHLNVSEKLLLKTAYDETINTTLSGTRKNAKFMYTDFFKTEDGTNKKFFEPDIANKDVPFEFKESREIRLGRNKLFMADVHGNQKYLFSTFKTAKDQGLTFLYHEESAQISQIRLRGNIGESLLIESKSDEFSRINLKGVSGHILEMTDTIENKNYIYLTTSSKDYLSQDWSLSDSSYFILANKQVISGQKRLSNNSVITHYDGRAGSSGRYTISGVYDKKVSHAYNALLIDPSKQAYSEYWTQYNPNIWVHDVRRGLSSDAQGFYRVQKPGKYIQYTYSAENLRWQLHNTKDTNIEINDLNVIINSGKGGTAKFWSPGGSIDIKGDSKVDLGSKSVINAVAPTVHLGSQSASVKVVRDGDEVTVNVIISANLIQLAAAGLIPSINVTASGTVKASEGPVVVVQGNTAESATVQTEYNLQGGGI